MSAPPDPVAGPLAPAPSVAQRLWRRFCQLAIWAFYRRCEVTGGGHLPAGPLILCANHANALVDGLIVQASCRRIVHPLARSGLFRSPVLRPFLNLIQAVPIYRRRAGTSADPRRNEMTFARCYDYLAEGRALLIFPEGQSHSDPALRPLKTGAARLALGFWRRRGRLPAVVPVGLIFTHKGRFRGDVLVQYGPPVALEPPPAGAEERAVVAAYTAAITAGLRAVTLNVEAWEDVALMKEIQAFADFRRGRRRRRLSHRYRAFQRLADAHRWLRLVHPEEVMLLRRKLRRFARLRRRYGVASYHLELRYRPAVVARFLGRSLFFALLVFPLALWGLVMNGPAYLAARITTRRLARGRDQYDTAGLLSGLLYFTLFWSGQTVAVYRLFGLVPALAYAVSLPLTGAVALLLGRERRRTIENVRVFFLFLRQRHVRAYLLAKRQEIEVEIARLARLVRHGVPQPRARPVTFGTDPPAPATSRGRG